MHGPRSVRILQVPLYHLYGVHVHGVHGDVPLYELHHTNVILLKLFIVEVDEVDLSVVLKDCLPDWASLGLMLDISKTDIDIIDDRDPYSKYLREMISYWLENSNEPFWEVLIDAIDSLQNRRLANALKEEFLK